jgi:hypothetical protein
VDGYDRYATWAAEPDPGRTGFVDVFFLPAPHKAGVCPIPSGLFRARPGPIAQASPLEDRTYAGFWQAFDEPLASIHPIT